MAELAGYLNEVYVLAGTTAMGAATGAKILSVDNATFQQLCDLLEITQFGEANKKRHPGLKDNSMSISGNINSGDTTGQDVLVPGAFVYIGVYPAGPTAVGTQMPALIESFESTYAVADMDKFSCSFQGNGASVELPAQT